jgi:uncharacterized damage-inducible protein DinB
MSDHPFCQSLANQRAFFLRTTSCFRPQDAGFAPVAGMFTVAGQIAHAAFTVDWFMSGAFSPQGFDMDFPAHEAAARAVTGLDQALTRFTTSYDAAIAKLAATPMAELHLPIAAGPILGGAPRVASIQALADHSAHHRGALTVYARLLNLQPPMPYA